jgi:hypothetical protein
MSNVVKVSTSAFAIAALLAMSAAAQARDYRQVWHRHAHVGHENSNGQYDYYGYRGRASYNGGPGSYAPVGSRLGYDGRDSNGASRGGSDVGQFDGGPGR